MARRRSSTSGQHRAAVLSEISNDLETDRAYLNMDAKRPASDNREFQKRCCFVDWPGYEWIQSP